MTEQPAYPPPYSTPPAWPSQPPATSNGRLSAGLIGGAIGGFVGLVVGAFATFVILGSMNTAGAFASLGEDPRIDGLYDMCGEGNMAACDLLFYESAVGSELEQFANTCGERTANPGSEYCTVLKPEGASGSLEVAA